MIKEVTVTLTVPADRLADLQAFCQETNAVAAPPVPPEPKAKRKPKAKSADTKEARQTEAKKEAEPAPAVSLTDIRGLLGQCVDRNVQGDALAIMKSLGAPTLPELPEEKFAEFKVRLEELLA